MKESRISRTLSATALVALIVVAYWPVRHGGMIWDDATTLLGLPQMREPNGLAAFWRGHGFDDYWPLHYSLLWSEWQLWQQNTFGYHLVSMALHAVVVLVLWRLLVTTKLVRPGVAWVASALFAVHPVNAEAVAWIVQQKTLQSAAYGFASLYAYVRFDQSREAKANYLPWYLLTVAFFAASLLAKSASLLMPVVLAGYLFSKSETKQYFYRLWPTAPFFAASAACGLLGLYVHSQYLVYAGGVRTDGALSRLFIAAKAVWFYLAKAAVPVDLAFIYARWKVGATDWLAAAPLVLLTALAAALAASSWLLRRRRDETTLTAASTPALVNTALWGLAYFVCILLPCLGFADISFMKFALVADHWQYLAVIAPLTVLTSTGAWCCSQVTARFDFATKPLAAKALPVALATAALALLTALNWRHLDTFSGDEAAWRDALSHDPNAFIANNNLGQVLMTKHDYASAAEHFAAAAAAAAGTDDAEAPLLNQSEALRRVGAKPQAEALLRDAARRFPSSVLPHSYLATALSQDGRAEEALAEERLAVSLAPDDASLQTRLGTMLIATGENSAAVDVLNNAVRLAPNSAPAQAALGYALIRQDQPVAAAEPSFTRVSVDAPKPEARSDPLAAAEAALRKATRLDPSDPASHQDLAYLLAQRGALPEAISEYQAAARLSPMNADIHLVLGLLLGRTGAVSAARGELARAYELAPNDQQINAAAKLAGILQ